MQTTKELLMKKRGLSQSSKDKLHANLSKLDKLQADLLHVLEFNKLNGVELVQIASKLKRVLETRGSVKLKIRKMEGYISSIDQLLKVTEMKRDTVPKAHFVKREEALGLNYYELMDKIKIIDDVLDELRLDDVKFDF